MFQSSCMSVPPYTTYIAPRTLADRHTGDETIKNLYYGLKNGL